ncbi:unnamed protein product [Rotaria socialis]|uniref:Protein kinase domain-containing protein n=2 Tax=Rotaria TaxID=231623 RepID=A0A818K3Y3_9BILA|nr:unnamed protein product [Rotaria socialis]CAF3336478.1 unnamed protein product [Rotaria socialis]CAF3342507.1 unnamed protein product [Rotaria socialis]CAF3423563.1 unnamed protein product [Rotaria socialis]CAF3555386.1 unnamed protein product [Rotaria socialis]
MPTAKSENYVIDEVIVEDSLVGIYKARYLPTNAEVAIKKIKVGRHGEYTDWAEPAAENEMQMLRKLNHSNVIKLLDSFYTADSKVAVLVFELMFADLGRLIHCTDNRYNHSHIKCMTHMMLSGLEYIHASDIMHLDIKPGNIMIDNQGIIKIADFGISIYVDDTSRKLHRLPPAWYRSPEFLLGDRQYGTSTDLWSLGVVIGELINRHIVFPSKSEIEQILMIYRLLGPPDDKTWPEAKTFKHFLQFHDESLLNHEETFEKKFPRANEQELILLKSLLVMNPKHRATAKQALESSYFITGTPICKPEDIPRSAAPRHRHSRDPFHMNDLSINDENLPSDYSHLNNDTKRQLFSP